MAACSPRSRTSQLSLSTSTARSYKEGHIPGGIDFAGTRDPAPAGRQEHFDRRVRGSQAVALAKKAAKEVWPWPRQALKAGENPIPQSRQAKSPSFQPDVFSAASGIPGAVETSRRLQLESHHKILALSVSDAEPAFAYFAESASPIKSDRRIVFCIYP